MQSRDEAASAVATPFQYLLNALEKAAAQDRPADHDYYGQRRAVLQYVTDSELRNARYEADIATLNDSLKAHELRNQELSEALADARRLTDWEREIRLKIVSFVNAEFFADVPDSEEDGFGGGCVQPCQECGLKLMQVVRPGKVQCGLCG